MKIAVVGTGISGMSAAWLLSGHHDVTVFEKNGRLGGHTNTRVVQSATGPVSVDTGFIVHNDRNYPRLIALLQLLNVETQVSNMSFAASLDDGKLEYAGDSLFAQRSNVIRPSHWKMLLDITRFNRLGKLALRSYSTQGMSLGDWLDQHRFSQAFEARYLLPMAASIWSSPSHAMRDFSAQAFLEFFNNHGLLDLSNRPIWRTLKGGSVSYLHRLARDLEGRVRTSCAVVSVRREAEAVWVTDEHGHEAQFDAVVFGSHADETLAMLKDPDIAERALLGTFKFRENRAILHSDEQLMPRLKRAWSSWNYMTRRDHAEQSVSISYWMNRLQALDGPTQYFVTLNPLIEPRAHLVHYETQYTHPIFDVSTREAQASMGLLQGHRRSWYCGAWMGYGFHEDGLGSAIEVVKSLGVGLPESLEHARQPGPPYMNNKNHWSGAGGELINI